MGNDDVTARSAGAPPAAASRSREHVPDWLWFGYDGEDDAPVISFGRWPKSSCQRGYVLTSRDDFNGYKPHAAKWQPIETAPKDGRHLLLFTDEGIKEGWYETGINFSDRFNNWTDGAETAAGVDCGFNLLHPTHWMSLPEPPE